MVVGVPIEHEPAATLGKDEAASHEAGQVIRRVRLRKANSFGDLRDTQWPVGECVQYPKSRRLTETSKQLRSSSRDGGRVLLGRRGHRDSLISLTTDI